MVSRVGKLPIKVADDVKVNIDNSVITFTKGNKTKTYDFGNKVNVSFKDKEIIVEENDDVDSTKFCGLHRSNIFNITCRRFRS